MKNFKTERYDFVNSGGVMLYEEITTLEEAKEIALHEFQKMSDKEKKKYEILVIEEEVSDTDENEETIELEDMIIPFCLNSDKIDEMVDKAYEHIVDIMSNYQKNNGNKYNNIDLEINDYVKSKFESEDKIIQDLVIWNTEDMIKEDELEELEDIRTELEEELLNKEFTFLELDNTVEGIMYTESAFEYDIKELLESAGVSYYYSDNHDIDIEFEIVEIDKDNKEYSTIKVTHIDVN